LFKHFYNKKLAMSPGQNFLLLELDWVSHLWFGFGKFPLKIPNFSIFSLQVKKSHHVGSKSTQVKDGLASYLLGVKSMLGSGWVRPISKKTL